MEQALLWTVRVDRGLTPPEQDEFSQWLAGDSRNRAAWAEHRHEWEELDRLAGLQCTIDAVPDPDLLRPARARLARLRPTVWMAAAAVVAFAAFIVGSLKTKEPAEIRPSIRITPGLTRITQQHLSDGTVVELNRGAIVDEYYSQTERRVSVRTGEAHFTVVKDPSRPFVVEVGGVSVRAVGTAFNIRLADGLLAVIVTAGRVQVGGAGTGVAHGTGGQTLLSAGQSTTINLSDRAAPLAARQLSAEELEQFLAWQPRVLDFNGASLHEIMHGFNRHNPVHLVTSDPQIADLRLSATIRSDNVEGFLRLLRSAFQIEADWKDDGRIVLTRAR